MFGLHINIRTLLLVMLMALPVTAFAQIAEYSARVVDARTGEPLVSATVAVASDKATVTNGDGVFSINADADDVLRISYIGYKSLVVRAKELPMKIALQPAEIVLDEVVAVSFKNRIKEILRKATDQLHKHRKATANYLYRQTTHMNEQTTSLVEAFFQAKSAFNISDMRLINGRYSEIDASGSYMGNAYSFSEIGLVRDETQLKLYELFTPLFWGYHQYYNVDYDIVDDGNRKMYVISYEPKKSYVFDIIKGKVYVDMETLSLLKAEGSISNLNVLNRLAGSKGESLNADMTFVINYDTGKDFSEVQTVNVELAYADEENTYMVRSLLYNVGNKDVSKGRKAVATTDLRRQIDKIGYDAAFWQDNEIVKRRNDEAQLAAKRDIRDGDGTIRLQQFVRNIDRFNSYFPQEKVYLHFDNTGYFQGEKIWFKAYVMRDDKDWLTDMSKVLYVELLNPGGDVLQRHKLYIKDGQADGNISLDNLLHSGFYEVRAYTRYMTNWGTDAVFSRVLPVFKKPETEGDYSKTVIDAISHLHRLPDSRVPTKADSAVAVTERKNLRVMFYPEGGNMIEGLLNRVAFDVTDADGLQYDTDGWLLSDNDTIGPVRTMREGRGWFNCLPQAGRQLRLLLTNVKGKAVEFKLPKAEPDGIVMRTNTDDSTRISITVQASQAVAGQTVGLLVTHNGCTSSFMPFEASSEKSLFALPLHDMHDGVNRISIINADGQVLADRMVFVYPREKDKGIAIETNGLMPYGKVAMTATALPETTFSLSVRDAATEVNGSNGNCMTWLLLSSDLKGYINDVDYYFESNDLEHRRAADLLMMVQGWRRYDLKEMMTAKRFHGTQIMEDGLYVLGKLIGKKKKHAVGNVALRIALYNKQGQSLSGNVVTDSTGVFAFKVPDSYGDWTMLLNTKDDSKNTDYLVSINRNFSPAGRKLSASETMQIPLSLSLAETTAEDIEYKDTIGGSMTEKTHQLKEVEITKKRKRDFRVWQSEDQGKHWADIHYDISEEADRLLDLGEDLPTAVEWLLSKNKLLQGTDDGGMYREGKAMIRGWSDAVKKTQDGGEELEDDERIRPKDNALTSLMKEEDLYKSKESVPAARDLTRTYVDSEGLSYKNRPIVWILNNAFYMVTGNSQRINRLDINNIFTDSNEEFPIMLDEMKSVYISEDMTACRRYVDIPKLMPYNPVTIFVYTHRTMRLKNRGLRSTSFAAYDTPETFKSPDYSVLPKEPDHRRTLYWNPNVKTDKDGKAKVEFYNNFSCKQVVISAEGITAEGRAIKASPPTPLPGEGS